MLRLILGNFMSAISLADLDECDPGLYTVPSRSSQEKHLGRFSLPNLVWLVIKHRRRERRWISNVNSAA